MLTAENGIALPLPPATGCAGYASGPTTRTVLISLLVQRKKRAFVLEQHDAFPRPVQGDAVVLFVVLREREIGLVAIEPAEA
jgi:hypothetical protein